MLPVLHVVLHVPPSRRGKEKQEEEIERDGKADLGTCAFGTCAVLIFSFQVFFLLIVALFFSTDVVRFCFLDSSFFLYTHEFGLL